MSINYKKVEGQTHLVKNVGSGTFINTNTDAIRSSQLRHANNIDQEKKTDQLKDDIETLKDEMLDIKSLLNQILEK
jgi:hypothetical protein